MTEKEFQHEYMGIYVSDKEIIEHLENENAELKKELEKEQNLNKVIKERLVEVNCDCNAEKKEKCVMFPEYCEGERKTVVDLMALVSDGLNETLIKQKEEQIEVKKLEILELKAQIEKMKNFYNCAHSNRALCPNEHNCKGCKDWELPE